jgi:hypothetical protein
MWVPSPLVGEGQEEGAYGFCCARHPLSLALSRKGRGDLESVEQGKRLKLGLVTHVSLLLLLETL